MRAVIILFILFAGFNSVQAQYNTGDSQLNASLLQIDANASVNFSLFSKDMSTTYSVPETKINSWSVEFGLKGGDIYFALELAKITKRPVDEVVTTYNKDKKRGWGAIAKDLGIKPGSAEFKALKGSASQRASKGKQGKGKKK